MKDNGLLLAIEEAGGIRSLSRKLGISHNAIRQWKDKIPDHQIIAIEQVTGVPREVLRPDLYRCTEDQKACVTLEPDTKGALVEMREIRAMTDLNRSSARASYDTLAFEMARSIGSIDAKLEFAVAHFDERFDQLEQLIKKA